MIQSGSGQIPFVSNPLHMELIAGIDGLKATIALGIHSIILETDA